MFYPITCQAALVSISRRMGREDLHGDRAAQARIGGLIYFSHATCADFLDDAIVAEGLADHGRLAGILRRGLQRVNVPVTRTPPDAPAPLGLDLVRAECGASAKGHQLFFCPHSLTNSAAIRPMISSTSMKSPRFWFTNTDTTV